MPENSSRVCSRWKITKIRSAYSGVDADAVIADREGPFAVVAGLLGRDVDARRLGAAILEGVADEVLEQLAELQLVGHEGRQRRRG